MKFLYVFLLGLFSTTIIAQQQRFDKNYWQQRVEYKMDVKMDVETFLYQGTQELKYYNNSPDTLRKVYYHLYFNAFQPGSQMDVRLSTIADPDKRMVVKKYGKNISKISLLKPNEIGFLKVKNMKQDGVSVETRVDQTILEVSLSKPLLPNQSTVLTMDFEGQVPVMIRRAGRNSAEGVALSMSQWYPKMAEFDFEGWHADPYIGREFHGVWGDFDVKLTLDKNYVVGGTGYLQNPNQIGHGYQDSGVEVKIPKKQKTLTWHFVAPNVHDFAWGADPEFAHDIYKGPNGVDLHFLYKKNKPELVENWKKLQPKTAEVLQFFNQNIGEYPYKQYSVIQGGDGGMEYAMCTLITGERDFQSLLGVTAHELAHKWFQHVLATNESKHGWMDEGFTSFISDLAAYEVTKTDENSTANPWKDAYDSYYYLVKSNKERPLGMHADRYPDNMSYSIGAYSKGTVFLTQLAYVIGWENLFKSLKRFYEEYKFTHPTPNDFKRTAERVSGAMLDWYLVDFTQTTNTVDYAIKSVSENNNSAEVKLERIGQMPMPLDILVVYEDYTFETFYIPNPLMHWIKEDANNGVKRTVLKGWHWANPDYTFSFTTPGKKIIHLEIDPSGFMADVDRSNNVFKAE